MKKKAKLKRDFERQEALRKKTSDNTKIDKAFPVLPKKRTFSLDDDDDNNGPEFDLGRADFVDLSCEDNDAEVERRRVPVCSSDTSISLPETRPSVAVFDDKGRMLKPSEIDWPEMQVVLNMLRKVELGCRCHPACKVPEHRHDEDDSVLAELLRTSDAKKSTPISPFDREKFPLFDLLPEARSGFDAKAIAIDESIRMTSTEILRLSKLLMRLREHYFQELANLRAGYDARLAAIDKQHRFNLVVAEMDEDTEYKSEILAAKGEERDAAKRVFNAQLDVLETSIHESVVKTVIQAGPLIELRLPFPLLIKSYMDVIRLCGGAEYDTNFFANLFIDVTGGHLDTLVELKKEEVETDHALRLDAYFVDVNDAVISNKFHAPVPSIHTEALGDKSFPKKRRSDEIVADEQLIPDEPETPREPHASPEEEPQQSDKYVKYPCFSQFAINDAALACSAIALVVAMRQSVVHNLPTVRQAGIASVVEDFLDYNKLLEAGANIWRNWRRKRHTERALVQRTIDESQALASTALSQSVLNTVVSDIRRLKTKLADLKTEFMLPREVVETSDYVRDFIAKNRIVTSECSGFWANDALDLVPNEAHGDQVALLGRVLETERDKGPFGAVLTIRGSSMCVSFVADAETGQEAWYIFDSHGLDTQGMSTLAHLPGVDSVIQMVNNTFECVELSEDASEYAKMQTNSYCLYILRERGIQLQ